MSNESDLDWLARNVHEWKGDDCKFIYAYHSPDAIYPRWLYGKDSVCQRSTFTRDQWLARRAELQNKPSWDDAPVWAEWLAQDNNGKWFYYAAMPYCGSFRWDIKDYPARNYFVAKGEVLGDWHDTLERRPQEAKPEPSSDDWHKRGELPPVGTVCLYVISDRCSCEVEITAHAKLGICFVETGKMGENYVSKTDGLHRFRPLPTERERVASKLVDVMMAVPASDGETTSEHHMRVALAVYDHLHKDDSK